VFIKVTVLSYLTSTSNQKTRLLMKVMISGLKLHNQLKVFYTRQVIGML